MALTLKRTTKNENSKVIKKDTLFMSFLYKAGWYLFLENCKIFKALMTLLSYASDKIDIQMTK